MKNKSTIYTTKEVVKITGETKQRIQYWILNGIVIPYDPSTGTGTSRHFSFENMLEISIAQSLAYARLSIKIITYIMKQIRKDNPNYFSSLSYSDNLNDQMFLLIEIVGPDGSVVLNVGSFQENNNLIPEKSGRGNLLMMLNLDALKKEIAAKIDDKEKTS